MAPSNVVSRPPQGIPKCRSPGPSAPVGAKFQLVGPMKERAPLAQCDTDSKFSGIESKSCSCSWSGAARVPQRPVVCWWQNCQVKRSRGVGKSESPGLEKELCTRRLSLPGASARDLFAKCRWSRGGQYWNEAAPPAPSLLERGPGRGQGDTPGRRSCFSKPSYRKPSGSPGGNTLPTPRNPLSGAGCEAVCKPLHPGRVQRNIHVQ